MRETCTLTKSIAFGNTPEEVCGKPAVDFYLSWGRKHWLCADHWDGRVRLATMLRTPLKRRRSYTI